MTDVNICLTWSFTPLWVLLSSAQLGTAQFGSAHFVVQCELGLLMLLNPSVKCSRINYTARCSQLGDADQCQPRSLHNLTLHTPVRTNTHRGDDLIIKSIWTTRASLMKQWSQKKFIWDYWGKDSERVCLSDMCACVRLRSRQTVVLILISI